MWSISFSILGGQYIIADVYEIEIMNTWTDFDGDGDADVTPLKSHLLSIINEETINETTQNIVTADFRNNSTYYDRVETFTTGAAFVAWELVTLLSGTYIFNLLYLLGIPLMFIAFFVILYLALLARAIIGYINRV